MMICHDDAIMQADNVCIYMFAYICLHIHVFEHPFCVWRESCTYIDVYVREKESGTYIDTCM